MAEIPSAAVEAYQQTQRLQARALEAAWAAWAELRVGALSRSWQDVGPALAVAVAQVQLDAATLGAGYSAATLAQQGRWVAPDVIVDPTAWVGYSSSGAELEAALAGPVVAVKQQIAAGTPAQTAMRYGQDYLEQLVRTQVADAVRSPASVDIAARPGVGYVRMLNPPSCSRCVVLAGKWFRWNAGFLRHPKCFPAGVVVSGPASEAATRRWYEGELVVLSTSSGQHLTLTGNHPVLTGRGWVPAHLIEEGDEVVRSTRPQGATPLVVPDHHQVPARVEDVWSAFRVGGLHRVPSAAEDFHGDGQHGEVDVVGPDGALRDGLDAEVAEHAREHLLAPRVVLTSLLDGQRSAQPVDLGRSAQAGGAVGGRGLTAALLSAHLLVPEEAGLARAAALHAGGDEPVGDDAPGDAVLAREGVLARAGQVGGDDLISRDVAGLARWDAPGEPFTVESAEGYASRGRDLLNRLAGQVELDGVVEVRRVHWSGHVYSLTSSEGWHVANSLIVSNCDCVHVASTAGSMKGARDEGLIDDPYEYFGGLSPAEQDRVFGRGGAQAIRDGADVYRVVNASRGRHGLFTTEGTGKRGFARELRGRRLTPDGIYRTAGSREEALRLLEQHGYVLPGGQVPGGSIRGGQYEGFGALGRGGTRVGARETVLEARRTGVRDPGSRYTATEAERRVIDSRARYAAVLQGRNPWSRDGSGLTPDLAARAESEYRRWLSTGGQIFT